MPGQRARPFRPAERETHAGTVHGVPSPTRHLILDPRGGKLLFQIITAREERAFIACASNAPSPSGATPSPTPQS
jgi:hypothetical protein